MQHCATCVYETRFNSIKGDLSSRIDPRQVDKFLPFYQRKKLMKQQRPPPAVFEMTPCTGMLSPAERINVQIKFSPAEGVNGFFLRPEQRWSAE